MKQLWKLLNSRKSASWQLFVLLALLVLSSALPNEMTVSPEHWARLATEKPTMYWLATHLSTPFLVRSWPFLAVCVVLFVSTALCTVTRVNRWLRFQRSEFEKDKAFSFSLETSIAASSGAIGTRAAELLGRRGWECGAEDGNIAATKGMRFGFWGSVVFHAGLLLCFLAAPISALTVFRGEFVVTEGISTPFPEGFVSHEGKPLSTLPSMELLVTDLEGVYAEGIYEYDFSGTLHIGPAQMEVSVNNPATYRGYQMSLDSFGYSPNVVVEKDGAPVFDFFLNQRHPNEGDYFEIPGEDLALFTILFPDFVQEESGFSSRSRELRNPRLLIRLLRGGGEVHRLLLGPGEEAAWDSYRFRLPEIRNWAGFMVVREQGMAVMGLGFLVGIGGLLVRFMSNERRLEVLVGHPGSPIVIRGYSRYYPAFLEKEVRSMAGELAEEGQTLGTA